MSALLSHPFAPALVGGVVLVGWYFWPALWRRWRAPAAGDPIQHRLAAYAALMQCLSASHCRDALDALDSEVLPHLFHEEPADPSDRS